MMRHLSLVFVSLAALTCAANSQAPAAKPAATPAQAPAAQPRNAPAAAPANGAHATAPGGLKQFLMALAEREKEHRERQAQLARLTALYTQKNDAAKLAEVKRLATLEMDTYIKSMDAVHQRLGEERFQQWKLLLEPGRKRTKEGREIALRRLKSAQPAAKK